MGKNDDRRSDANRPGRTERIAADGPAQTEPIDADDQLKAARKVHADQQIDPTEAVAVSVEANQSDLQNESAGEAELPDQPPAHDSLENGTILRDRFRITGVLGSGGMGTVYRATDLLKEEACDEHTDVALKVLTSDLGDAELSFMALQREARRAQQLAHPNIVTVYDFDRADDVIFMTMEMMEGLSLEDLIDEHPGGIDPKLARRVTRHVTEGLAYAHKRGFVHSDLKPENVFVLNEGRAKILDFGIARAYGSDHRDFVEEIIRGCTPAYATPELLARKKSTPSDDVYALGCVIYETFTGQHPYNRASGADARKAGMKPKRASVFSRAEWKAVAAALSLDAKRRPADAGQFLKRFFPSPIHKRMVAVSLLALAGMATYTLVHDPAPGPDVPFESLSVELQQRITGNLEDAELFLEQGDINSALQLYDSVLRAHPGNPDGVRGMNETARAAIQRIEQAHGRGELSLESARQSLEALLGYDTLPSRSRDRIAAAMEEH